MKKTFFAFMMPFMLLAVIISCKKETSCEGCSGDNKPPIAVAGPDQVITLPTDSVLLDGTASGDPDGRISSFLWTKISGPASFTIAKPSDSITQVKTLVTGTYLFELKVTDNGGLSAKDTVQLKVNDPVQSNRPPVANAGPDQSIISPTNNVLLDGSGSIDPDNNIVQYAWSKVSGPVSLTIISASAVQTQVANFVQGTYLFELKVTDAGGLFSKDTVQVNANAPFVTNCDVYNRPTVNVQVIHIATVPQPASLNELKAVAIAGNKIVFAGGVPQGNYEATARVDIYDLITNSWTTTQLSQARYGIGVAVWENKIFFAGGIVPGLSSGPPEPVGAGIWYTSDVASFRTAVIDIYDAATNTWSIDRLSSQRVPVGITVNNKVIFAGSDVSYQSPLESSKMDIYDAGLGTWTTAVMSEPRDLEQPAVEGNRVYFAGGSRDFGMGQGFSGGLSSKRIDIYDALTGLWSIDNLSRDRLRMGNIIANNKLYCGGGIVWDSVTNWWTETNSVEIRNLITNTTSFDCLHEAKTSQAARMDNKIIFYGGTALDILDLTNDSWSIGVLSQKVDGTVIAYNNEHYVTDGKQIWKLKF